MPDDWRSTRAVTIGREDLREVPDFDLETRHLQVAPTQPNVYAFAGRTMRFGPLPDGEYEGRHFYYVLPDFLASDDSETRIPDQHIGVIVAKAAQLCAIREDDRTAAGEHLAEYMMGVEKMRAEVRSGTRPTTPRIRRGSLL